MKIYVIGADPGKTGAIVGVGLKRLVILRTPHMKSATGRGEEILYSHMWNEFEKLFMEGTYTPKHAFIERVQAMPKQGGSSMFKFGYSAGFLRGIIAAARIPNTMVEPRAWKKSIGIPSGSDKALSINHACRLFPNDTKQLTPRRGEWNKQDCIGVAEAALIGWYGLQLLKNK